MKSRVPLEETGWAPTQNLVKIIKLMKPHTEQAYKRVSYSHNEASGKNKAGLSSLSEIGDREDPVCGYRMGLGDEKMKPNTEHSGYILCCPEVGHKGLGWGCGYS